MKTSGVYRIVHWPTGRSYIGVSNDILRRWVDHVFNLTSGASNCLRLKRAWAIHGSDEFYFETIRICSLRSAYKDEPRFIRKYDSLKSGFNCTAGGDISPMLGRKHTAETKLKISRINLGRKHTLETRRKVSLALSLRVATPSLRAFRSSRMKGNKINVGRKLTKYQRKTLKAALLKRWADYYQNKKMNFHLDYETFSEVDLNEVGGYRYAEDPSTEILFLTISADEGPVFLWVNPKYREVVPGLHDIESEDLILDLKNSPLSLVFCHTAMFERAITMFVQHSPISFMRQRARQWRCTEALCRRAGIPASLAKAVKYLKLGEEKDAKGKALIKLFCELNKPKKKKGDKTVGPLFRVYPKDQPDKFRQFGEYCRQDVVAEKGLHKGLKFVELRGPALDGYMLDIHLNDRGIPVDVPTLRNAKRIIDKMLNSKYEVFTRLTGLQATQREAVKNWLEERGCVVANMQAETLDEKIESYQKQLDDPLDKGDMFKLEECMTVMRLYTELSFAAVKKVTAMLDCVNSDGRIRGTLQYSGTGPGRSSARLVQPQNFKKAEINPQETEAWLVDGTVGKVKWPKNAAKPTEVCYELLRRGADAEDLDLIIAEPLEAIASSIRHFIPATLDADYAGLQARVVNWLAGQEDALQRFRDNIDAYKVLAAVIFNIRQELIDNPSKERDLGKVGELGCGFQMGPPKFLHTCHFQYGLTWVTSKMAARTVEAYRSTHPKVVQFWWDLDRAARRAVAQPNRRFTVGQFISMESRIEAGMLFLFARLPSGREIAYADPKIETWTNKKTGDVKENALTYYGKPSLANGATGTVWMRVPIYGGKFAENVTMGVEADLVVHGVTLAISKGFDPFVLVHDQALAERKEGQIAPDYAKCLADLPVWANGLPLKVEAKFCKYYAK